MGKRAWVWAGVVVAVLLAVFWRDMFIAVATLAVGGMLLWSIGLGDLVLGTQRESMLDGLPIGEEGMDEYLELLEGADGDAPPSERELDACRECGGWCCVSLYLPVSEGGVMPDDEDIETRLRVFHGERDYGVEPVYDPIRVHVDGDADYIVEVCDSGLNPYSCEYLGHDGCLLPRGLRPAPCLEFSCEKTDEARRESLGLLPVMDVPSDDAGMLLAAGVAATAPEGFRGSAAVVVDRDGRMLGTGRLGEPKHPLAMAVEASADEPGRNGGTAYVLAHEPCCPECVELVRQAGIASLRVLGD